MSLTVFLAMIASAFLHATWNAWVKSRRDSNAAVACLVIGAGFPNLAVIAAFGWPAAPAWPWIACTVTLSMGSLTLLAKAYREGDFAVAFPMIRGAIPVVLVLAAVPLFHETPQADVARMLVREWPVTVYAALISSVSYQLFIWSLQQAPVALVGAMRETSMLFALFIAFFVLRERFGGWRWVAVALMLAGMLLMRL